MKITDIIAKKLDNLPLSRDEYAFWCNGAVDGSIPDYQSSALLTSCYLRGISDEECVYLTEAMAYSGETLDLSISGTSVDKHSTGGVGDTTTLIVLPALACAGAAAFKMSGRGLSHTGGTVDKMESIEGYSADITEARAVEQVRNIGVCLIGQTRDIAPADKIFYSLREATCTVDNIKLIAASIMSKKIAGGAQNIVLDVKCGKGAFMKNIDDARNLAGLMVKIGKYFGKRVRAVITAMNYPLSNYIGNAVEVYGALRVLRGERNSLASAAKVLAVQLLQMMGVENAEERYDGIIDDGAALYKFTELVAAQGGNVEYLTGDRLLDTCGERRFVYADAAGYVEDVDALKLGETVRSMGGGRYKIGDVIDGGVGIEMRVRVGDKVERGAEIARVYGPAEFLNEVKHSIKIGDKNIKEKLILDIIGDEYDK